MMPRLPRTIGVLTAGGDCPGLNAVIRGVTRGALRQGARVVGIEDGFLGLIEDRTHPLDDASVANILIQGGTILGSDNKANPGHFAVGRTADGAVQWADVTPRCLAMLERHGIEALFVIGGDGSMISAAHLAAHGVNCIGLPKTIDNDLWGTDLSFGFLTAVQTAADALDKIRTTAASHHRVMVVEVMGRNAGWLALHAGVATGSDIILIPEIPFDIERVCERVRYRAGHAKRFSIVCVSEGARPVGGKPIVQRVDPTSPDPIRLGGIAQVLSAEIEARTGLEARYTILGHVQRGGSPIAVDRVLGTQLAYHGVTLLARGESSRLVVYRNGALGDIDIQEPRGRQRVVPPDHPLIEAARSVGTTFGD